jgi:hypothetical protein
MRYYMIALSMLVSGCASVSEYNRGCRDGITETQPTAHILPWPFNPPAVKSQEEIEAICNELESRNKPDQDRPRGRSNR